MTSEGGDSRHFYSEGSSKFDDDENADNELTPEGLDAYMKQFDGNHQRRSSVGGDIEDDDEDMELESDHEYV